MRWRFLIINLQHQRLINFLCVGAINFFPAVFFYILSDNFALFNESFSVDVSITQLTIFGLMLPLRQYF
jgi:hypothetical protein